MREYEIKVKQLDMSELNEGDIIIAPDKILDGDNKQKRHKYRIIKKYPNFFTAERLDRHFERSFVNSDYLIGLVKKAEAASENDEM